MQAPEQSTSSATEYHHTVIREVEHELGVFYRRAAATSRAISRDVHPELEPAAYGLMIRIDAASGTRLTDLAAYFGINKSSVSRQLASLVELGLVERTDDPDDRRAQALRLTAEGRARLQAAREARRTRMRELLGTWPDSDIRQLGVLLRRYNELFE